MVRHSNRRGAVQGKSRARHYKPAYPFDNGDKQRFNPELQRRSLENRQKNQEEFDQFVTKLKEYSKSNKPSKR
jgi:hypothetical protein